MPRAALSDDCVVLIGGEGELLPVYRKLIAARGLGDKVHLLGHVRGADLPSHVEACDVFCMPSTVRAEAYGVAMVEAMVMGKPIVATDIAGSGVPWVNVHGQTGLNVPVREPAALADALHELLADADLRRRMGCGREAALRGRVPRRADDAAHARSSTAGWLVPDRPDRTSCRTIEGAGQVARA